MWKAILAAMLFLQTPGRSVYSQVVVPESAPAPCSDSYSLLCLPPRWSAAHQGYTVAETWQQGVQRYALIAKALEATVSKKREAPAAHLWRYVLAFAYHESGFRRDVHEGLGPASRGDCDWRTVELPGGKTKRERIPGSCRSHCLAQIMIGPVRSNAKTSEGYHHSELVGTDFASTKRCLDVAVRVINSAYHFCAHHGERPMALCIVKHYAGGMIASNDARVLARIKTVNKLDHAPTKLEQRVREALNLDPAVDDRDGKMALR